MNLEQKIKDRIRREGPMTFEAFMQAALYEPGLGYYASPETEIGKAGDFYTSPHLSPLFGAMLGRQMEEFYEAMGRPLEFTIIEAGGGRGYLAKDLLDSLKDKPIFGPLRYVLVELNPHMAQRQMELLSDYEEKTSWVRSLDEIRGVIGAVISNELMDAFPVHIIEMAGGLKEVYVSLEGGEFVEVKGPPSTPALEEYFEEFSISLPEGYRTEINLRAKDWIRSASSAIEEGFVLTIDYGYPAGEYYDADRNRGTLLCYHAHNLSEDPYENVGRQDMTSHVNFSSLKKWGQEAGLTSLGFARQGPYLVSLGIGELIGPGDIEKAKGLFMPGTMGDTHKVLIQGKGGKNLDLKGGRRPLRGFSLSNKLKSL